MKKTEIAPGIVIYRDVVDGYESLVDDIESAVSLKVVAWEDATVKSGEKHSGVYKETRDTQTIGIPYSKNPEENLSNPRTSFMSILGSTFFNAFDPLEIDYARSYGIDLNWHDSYGILKYGVGQKFTNHIDDHKDYHRRLSTVYYLNDNYSGGEINFPRFDITYKPNANEIIMFPSTFVYNHSVNEVTEGTRYAVVSWLR